VSYCVRCHMPTTGRSTLSVCWCSWKCCNRSCPKHRNGGYFCSEHATQTAREGR
jgi:hypothetical protein